MKIKVNGQTQTCHRCGSENLEIISVNDENNYNVYCNNCNEQTLEDYIKIDNILFLDIWT